MKLSWPTRLLIAAGIFGTGTYVYWRWDSKRKRQAALEHRKSIRRKREKQSKAEGAADLACLEPYLQIGAKLSPQIRDGLTYAQRFVDPSDELGLTQRVQARAFASAARMANAGETEDLDRATQAILREVMPDCPWEKVAMPPDPESDWAIAFDGVQELLQLAALEMRYEDFHLTTVSGQPVGAGLVCPGWSNQAPAPTVGLAPGDLIEVVLGSEEDDGTPDYTEPAFAAVERVDGDRVSATLVGPETELSPGVRAPAIQGTAKHGYRLGSKIQLDRRCIYTVRRKGQS